MVIIISFSLYSIERWTKVIPLMIYYDVNIFYMNIIENIQKSYLPGFY